MLLRSLHGRVSRVVAGSRAHRDTRRSGIESLDGFDYGVFLRDSGIDTETYRKRVENDLPLGREYLTFQYTSASAFVDEVRKYAENLVKHPLMLSVNSAANGAKSLVIADKLTYFCGEVDRDAEEREFATKPILVFKLGDALDRPQVSTASGQDWAYCMEHDLTGLVRTWVAQSYAYGHQLMAPVKQWAYTKEKGTHWWETDPDDFTDLYQFIRANAALFDDHDAIADVGLVYSNANFRRYQRQAAKVAVELAHANVPFRLLLAGDDWLPNRITAKDVADLKAIIVTEPLDLDAEQQTVLDAAADRVISLDRLPGMLAPQVTVTGADNVTVIPRATADGRYAIHLVNRNYDGESDAMIAQTEFTVSLSTSLFDGEPNSATLHAPGAEPVALALTKSPDAIDLRIPTLDLWAIIEIVVP